jgi:hypothetical protein
MATINKGILGGISGTIGNVVGSNWNGIDVLRTLPASYTDAGTETQVAQRYKFTAVLNFLKPLTEIVRIGYNDYAVKMSAFNAAFCNTIKNAVTGTSPDFAIDYPNVQLTRGNLENTSSSSVSSTLAATVTLTWDTTVTGYLAKADDNVLAVVFNPTRNQAVYSMNQAIRSAGTLAVDVPAFFSGDTVHVYLSFASASSLYKTPDRNSLSVSLYSGSAQVV